ECPRDVLILAARIEPEGRRDEDRVGHRRRENGRRQHQVAEDHAGAGERPGVAGDLEDSGTDEDADNRGLRFERAEIAPQIRHFSSRNPPILPNEESSSLRPQRRVVKFAFTAKASAWPRSWW